MLLPYNHHLQPELTQKAIEHLDELHESLSWHRIAQLVEHLVASDCRLWDLASEFRTSVHFVKAIYQLSFQTRDELKKAVSDYILQKLRNELRKAA